MAGNPSSCIIKIGKNRYRTLIDSGAEVSLISKSMFDHLPGNYKLFREKPNLQAVNGGSLSVLGRVNITFSMNGLALTHDFYVTSGLNRNFILGRDFLKTNGIRLYFDLGCLRFKKTYVQLQEDLHISSILRMDRDMTVKPQTVAICFVRLHKGFHIPDSRMVEVTNTESACILDEPGLRIQDSVHTVGKSNKLPIIIVNETNRHYRLKRGRVVGKAKQWEEKEVSSVEQVDANENTEEDFEETRVPEEFRDRVLQLVRQNPTLFAKKDCQLGHTDTVKMRIITNDHLPIKHRPYRAPLTRRVVIDKAINEMLEAGVIERSRSPWAFPLVVVAKKDGSERMCVDFRFLNKKVRPVSHPLPLIDDTLSMLGKAKYFTTLDLKSGYWQVKLEEDSKEKTAFTCHKGLFQFNGMPFGLSNAPAVFQELMNIVLQGYEDFSTAYLDDILIFSKSADEHLAHIQAVFDRLGQHGLKLKLKKCAFFAQETEYLGFIISVKPDQNKVKAIRTLPSPTCVREVRGVIGMCSYYRRFIPNFSAIAEPLIQLTRKYARFN